MLDPVPGDT